MARRVLNDDPMTTKPRVKLTIDLQTIKLLDDVNGGAHRRGHLPKIKVHLPTVHPTCALCDI